MKLEEMADFLDGLAGFLEKHANRPALNDLRAVSSCFRQFAGENVAAFCNFVTQARAGKAAAGRTNGALNEAAIDKAVGRIRRFLDQLHDATFADIDGIMTDLGKLKIAELRALADRLGRNFSGKTKAAILTTIRSFLSNVKMSADQSSFSLSGSAS